MKAVVTGQPIIEVDGQLAGQKAGATCLEEKSERLLLRLPIVHSVKKVIGKNQLA